MLPASAPRLRERTALVALLVAIGVVLGMLAGHSLVPPGLPLSAQSSEAAASRIDDETLSSNAVAVVTAVSAVSDAAHGTAPHVGICVRDGGPVCVTQAARCITAVPVVDVGLPPPAEGPLSMRPRPGTSSGPDDTSPARSGSLAPAFSVIRV